MGVFILFLLLIGCIVAYKMLTSENLSKALQSGRPHYPVEKKPWEKPNYNPLRDGGYAIGLAPRVGYGKYELVGMYFHISTDNWGRFNGYAIAEPDNPYDKNAIAIYEESGHKIGYVSKEDNKKLFKVIISNGGKVHAYGYVQNCFDGKMRGEVCVAEEEEVISNPQPYITGGYDKMYFGNRPQETKHSFTTAHYDGTLDKLKFPKDWVGKKIAILGNGLIPYTRQDIGDWIKNNGGLYTQSISSKTQIVLSFNSNIGECSGSEYALTKQEELFLKYKPTHIKAKEFAEKTGAVIMFETHTYYY